jgi:MoaA/NifB/PqqE/SkfB family radical SAM enzyme
MFTAQTKLAMLKAVLTKDSPFYIQFYVSSACNLECKMCNIVEANSDLKPFKTGHIEQIAGNLAKIGAGVVLLTGGEPFLRPDIDEIVRIFKRHNLDVRLQTAGLISKKDKILKCMQNGARDINVSIDSLDEKMSDYINGVPGSWRDALKTIAFISRTFPKKDSICAVGCVLSRYNLDEIDALLDFTTRIGWFLSLVPVHITEPSNPLNFRGYDEYFKFREEDFPKVKELIDRLKKKKKQGFLLFDSNDYLDSIYYFVKTGRPSWRHKGVCDTPNLYFAILPDGRFAPCCDFRLDETVYVYDKDFPEIYRSKQFREKVKNIAKKCPGCNFGSFPEMTLSARSIPTIFERIALQLKAQSRSIIPVGDEEIFGIVDEIKKKYPIYKGERKFLMRKEKAAAK